MSAPVQNHQEYPGPVQEYTVRLPYDLTVADFVGAGVTGIVARLDAVVKYFPPHRHHFLLREVEVYQRLKETYSPQDPRFLRFYGQVDGGEDGISILLGFACNGTLREYIRTHRKKQFASSSSSPSSLPPLSLRLGWVEQVADAVAALHAPSILHGDLSCNNFFVNSDLALKLGDFSGSVIDGKRALTLYETRSWLPASGTNVTVESEIFALGSCFYEIMAGERAYEELEDSEITDAYSQGQFPPVSGLDACAQIIKKCWTTEYETVAQVLQDTRAEVKGTCAALFLYATTDMFA